MLTMIYGVAAILGGGVLCALSHLITPILPMLLGLFFLPILTLTALRQYSLPAAVIFFLGLSSMTVMLAPGIGWGVLLAAVWYAGAMILRIGTDLTIDLFPLLFYGGALYLALITLGVALTVKDVYGVYDFRAVFTAVEEFFHAALVEIDKFYGSIMPKLEYEMLYQPMFDGLIKETEAVVYQLISFALVLFSGWYFFTLKIAQNLCRLLPKRIIAAPIVLYGVPREIAWCYLVLFGVSFFIGDTYFYAFKIALTLTGFLLVPAGVGVVDGFMHKWHPALRTLLKTLMLTLAFLGNFFGGGITYTVLMVGGLYISLFRRIIFKRMKGGQDDE